ncbi:MAG TPA: hypothetical protein VGK21_14265 [Candidatus Angelobacter sp.]|jgi:hypothetical protein
MAASKFDPISELAFLAAMQKAFKWDFPLPVNALTALRESSAFQEIFDQNRPRGADDLSAKDYATQHFEALANDPRVQFFVNEYLANDADHFYRRALRFLWKEFKRGFKNWLHRRLNPPENQPDEKPAASPRRVVRLRYPVLNTVAAAVVFYAGYYVLHHPPEIRVALVVPQEFPHIKIDSAPVKFDTAQVRFPDVKFEQPPELKVAKLQFGPAPEVKVARLEFGDPPRLQFASPPDFHLAQGGVVRLDTSAATLQLNQSANFKFDPLQFKDGFIPLKFDPEIFTHALAFKMDVAHHFDNLLQSKPQWRFSDKRQGFLWSSHVYTLEASFQKEDGSNSSNNKTNSNNNQKDVAAGTVPK